MPTTSAVASFGEILSAAWGRFKERKNLILKGAVLFALINAVLQGLVDQSARTVEQSGMAGFTTAEAGTGALLFLVLMAFNFIVSVYYLLVVVEDESAFGAVFMRSVRKFLPFIGLSIWVMLRSFAWIAFLAIPLFIIPETRAIAGLLLVAGIICSIIFGPRFASANIFWARDALGITASANKSYVLTKGYWGKVVGNLLLLGLMAFVLMIGASIISSIIGAIFSVFGAGIVSIVIISIFSQLYAPFAMAFLLRLTETIEAHPIMSVANTPANVDTAPTIPAPKKAVAKKKTVQKPASKKTS